MADINSKLEIGVTTGPIRGSRKIHVGPLRVAMREIALEPSSGEPPVRVYDTSGPYTDPQAQIDIAQGLPELRRDWIVARGDIVWRVLGPGEERQLARALRVPPASARIVPAKPRAAGRPPSRSTLGGPAKQR